ncbi:MAG: tetratricopeptide repeat protein [Candidatus Zhuqueibacterota bacterium]
MQKRYRSVAFIILMATYFFACSSGYNLKFYQPVKPNMLGIRKMVVAPCQSGEDAALMCSDLELALKNTHYFLVFDQTKFSSVLSQYKQTFETLSQADSSSKIGKVLNVDGLVFANLKSLELFPVEKGADRIEKMVWTGEYERDANGEIVEEVSADGKTVKKKKFKLQPVDQEYQIRNAKVSADFRLIDLKQGAVIYSQELAENYTSGKMVREEGQTLPTDEAVRRQILMQINRHFIREISPRSVDVKRVVESGPTLIDSGAVFARKGDWGKATEIWDQAKTMYPANSRVYYNLGLASEAQGDYESAEIYYRKAALLNAKSKLYQKAIEQIRARWMDQKK